MLDIDLVTILAEILNFLVLAAALYFLLFKPIVKQMEKRADDKAALLADMQQKDAMADEKLTSIESRLAQIDTEIEARLDKAFQQAQTENATLLDATRAEAEKIISEAEFEAAKRQEQEMEQLQDDLVDSILHITGQVLSKTTPDVVHDNLVEALNAEIWDLGKQDMRRVRTIRESLSERTPTAIVITARELSPEQQRLLVRTFSALADSNVSMEIEVDPNLIAGIRVRMGDLVVENTLAMELSELKSEINIKLEESIHAEE